MLFLVLDRAIPPDTDGVEVEEAVAAMRRSLEWVRTQQEAGRIVAHYALQGQHRAMTIFDVADRPALDALLAEWPKLRPDPEIYPLVGLEELEAFLAQASRKEG